MSGFGPVVDDGFGICYTIINDCITITITGKSSMQDSLEQFKTNLKQALMEMSALLH
ncbi:MAG: choline/carnitine O-acyltransferase [Deltaproteobacteria bacterium]|nr:choline/carnitine O-acyltransferase [Deltaproteobacteria bacterium]